MKIEITRIYIKDYDEEIIVEGTINDVDEIEITIDRCIIERIPSLVDELEENKKHSRWYNS